jgi:hypothetical protein
MRQLMDAHGPRAIAEAAQRAVESERMKDEDEAQTWRQVEAALKGSRVRSRADRRGRRMPARSERLGQAGERGSDERLGVVVPSRRLYLDEGLRFSLSLR